MAQPRREASTPRSQPWSALAARPERSREGSGETTQQIPRQTGAATAGLDDEFSAPRLSRAASLAAPTATATSDQHATQTLPSVPPPAPKQAAAARRRPAAPRRARLQVRHISAWTVLKFSALLAVALFLVWLIVIGLLYGALDGSGVIGKVNDTYTTLSGPGTAPPVTTGLIFSGALVVGAVGAVVFVALSTIGTIIYNLCADVVGGVEVTLAERD